MIINKEILTDLQVGGAIESDELIEKVLNILAPGPSLEVMVVGLRATDRALEPRDEQIRSQ